MPIFKRKIMNDLLKHLDQKQATIITGIRRSGKTTLVKNLLENVKSDNKLYIDLEQMSNRLLFSEENYENIINSLCNSFSLDINSKLYIAIDEIQFVKNIPSIVKYLYDHFDIKFILTGSGTYYLKNLFTESLAGRKKIFELYTLDFGEFLEFKGEKIKQTDIHNNQFSPFLYNKIKDYYSEFISFGGFPDVTLNPDFKIKKEILADILDSYIRIDIKNLIDFENYSVIYKILKLLSNRTASKLDVSKIANSAGVSRSTVSSYIELFEGTYIIKRLPVLSNSPDKEISKTPKIYFHDNGFLNILSEVSGGVQFENSVFNQLKHSGELNYYALKTGNEIDFILNKKYSYEAKEYCGDFDLKRLQRLSKNIKISNNKLIFRYPSEYMNEDYLWGGDIL